MSLMRVPLPPNEILHRFLVVDPSSPTGLCWKHRDQSDFIHLRTFRNFHLNKAGKPAGSRNTNEYWIVKIYGKRYYAHRLLWQMVHGPIPENKDIDHINCIGSDNRIDNLRLAGKAENNRNSRTSRANTSGYKGVFKARKGWRTAIRCNDSRKQLHLGTYSTKEEAAAVYADWAKRLHGQFARIA